MLFFYTTGNLFNLVNQKILLSNQKSKFCLFFLDIEFK